MEEIFDRLLQTIDNTISNTRKDIVAVEGSQFHFKNGKINGLKVARLIALDFKNKMQKFKNNAD